MATNESALLRSVAEWLGEDVYDDWMAGDLSGEDIRLLADERGVSPQTVRDALRAMARNENDCGNPLRFDGQGR